MQKNVDNQTITYPTFIPVFGPLSQPITQNHLKMKKLQLLLSILLLSQSGLFSQAGSPDLSFGNNGLAALQLGHGVGSATATTAEVAGDGKIWLGG